jgi:hypothetical protein
VCCVCAFSLSLCGLVLGVPVCGGDGGPVRASHGTARTHTQHLSCQPAITGTTSHYTHIHREIQEERGHSITYFSHTQVQTHSHHSTTPFSPPPPTQADPTGPPVNYQAPPPPCPLVLTPPSLSSLWVCVQGEVSGVAGSVSPVPLMVADSAVVAQECKDAARRTTTHNV